MYSKSSINCYDISIIFLCLILFVMIIIHTTVHFEHQLTALFTKAAGLTVHGHSTGLPGIIPKISKETAVQNALQTPFCTAAGGTAAL